MIGIEGRIIEMDLSMDKAIEKGLNMVRIIEEEILGEETIEEHKIIENKPLEGNIEVSMEMVILIGVEAGQEIDNVQIILGGMIEVALGKDQVLEQVLIETELDASSVGNMIILLRIVQM